jgi:dienelactone hydrolase
MHSRQGLKAWLAAVLLACAGCVVPPAHAETSAGAAPAPVPIDVFFERQALRGAALSPDGRRVALCIASSGARARLVVLDLQTMQPTVAASFSDADVGRFRWVNDQRLVFDLEVELDGPGFVKMGRGLFAVNYDGSGFRQLVETLRSFVKNGADAGVPVLPWNTFLFGDAGAQDSNDVLVVVPDEINRKSLDYINLRRLNTATGRTADIDAPLHSFGWVLDRKGELKAVVTAEGGREAVSLRDASGGWRKVQEYGRYTGKSWAPQFMAPDGRLIVRAANGDKAALFAADPSTGEISGKALVASPDYDIDAEYLADDKHWLGVRYTIDAEVTQWFDARMQAVQKEVDALLPATANKISVARRAHTPLMLVEAFSDVQPAEYYLYDSQAKKLRLLGKSHPRVDAKRMSPMDMVRITARDGLPIPAYLTLPAGRGKKNLPVVVLAHGGPWVRGATWRWNAEVQFLASRGYAVLQPEFRGSTGFGSRHFEAGWKQWGLAMQDDIADAARWAIAQGIADPKRICVAGASYGGYATLMALARDAELFRCGVQWVGVTDIDLMYSVHWSDTSDTWKRYGMPVLIGDREKDAAQFKAASPLQNAERIRQPLLMAYGAWDLRVPIVHGEKFRDAVQRGNKQVEWVVYADEGHGWAKPATQIDFWGRVERFLAAHIGP